MLLCVLLFQHPTTLKKLSEPHALHQPVSLPELESLVTERPQFSRQKDVPQAQVIPTLSAYKDQLDGVSLWTKARAATGGLH